MARLSINGRTKRSTLIPIPTVVGDPGAGRSDRNQIAVASRNAVPVPSTSTGVAPAPALSQ